VQSETGRPVAAAGTPSSERKDCSRTAAAQTTAVMTKSTSSLISSPQWSSLLPALYEIFVYAPRII
jgi:hypothetical protein